MHLTTDAYTVVYVHIAPGSAKVAVGQEVKAGDVLCDDGSVGFSPEAHLHMEVHLKGDLQSPSVAFAFGDQDRACVPCAGGWYGQEGECEPPAKS